MQGGVLAHRCRSGERQTVGEYVRPTWIRKMEGARLIFWLSLCRCSHYSATVSIVGSFSQTPVLPCRSPTGRKFQSCSDHSSPPIESPPIRCFSRESPPPDLHICLLPAIRPGRPPKTSRARPSRRLR